MHPRCICRPLLPGAAALGAAFIPAVGLYPWCSRTFVPVQPLLPPGAAAPSLRTGLFLRLFSEETLSACPPSPPRHRSARHGGVYRCHEVSDLSRLFRVWRLSRLSPGSLLPFFRILPHLPFSLRPPSSPSSLPARSIRFNSQSVPSGCRAVPPVQPHLRPGAAAPSSRCGRSLAPDGLSPSEPRSGRSTGNRGSEHSGDPGQHQALPVRPSPGGRAISRLASAQASP